MLEKLVGGKIIDINQIKDDMKKKKGTEEEPFEGEITDLEAL
jgi:hypothetical protein